MKKKILIKYWNKFYKNGLIKKESSFAKFVYKKIKNKKGNFLDIGCGNGRDSFFFNKKGFNVTGIDISEKAIKKNSKHKFKNLHFIKFDIGKNKIKRNYDVIYCRFFLHAINEVNENKFLSIIKKDFKGSIIIALEFRTTKDVLRKKGKKISINERLTDHYRRFIDINNFKKKLEKMKFKILYTKSGINLSKSPNDNPHLCRIVFSGRIK